MLAGKNIVIIGGTTGIGLSAALKCVEHGANVVVTGRNTDSCQDAQQQLGSDHFALSGDATLEGSAEEAIDACRQRWETLDGLYHVAGGSGRKYGDGPLHELSLSGWQATLNLNLTSVMLSNRAAIRCFQQQQSGGAILNMSSVLGISPSPTFFSTHAYAAAKAAIIGFSKSIAAHYAPDNIRVNVLAPALVDTPMAKRAAGDEAIQHFIKSKQPLDRGRMGLPKDLDAAAILLLSDESSFITGQVLMIDGGWHLSDGQINPG